MNKLKNDNNEMLIKNGRKILNLEYEVINYISLPSLKSIAITVIITRLWKLIDLKDSIQQHFNNYCLKRNFCDESRENSFHQMEEKILSKLSVLSLPSVLEVKASVFIRPIGFQILKWFEYIEDYFCISNYNEEIDSLNWAMDGTIDKANTLIAQLNGNVERKVSKYYRIACNFCLEDQVFHLWEQIPQNYKYSFNKTLYEKYDLVTYWTSNVKNDLSESLKRIKKNNRLYDYKVSIFENMLKLSILQNNALAVKYFWSKLTEQERSSNIVKSLDTVIAKKSTNYDYQNSDECTDILCFLLSQVQDIESQRVIFQKHNKVILERLFFNWPWQKFLVPTIKQMWDFLDEDVYVQLLSRIAREIKKGRSTEILLKELWANSPRNFNKCFIQYIIKNDSGTNILFNLLDMDELSTIMFLLKEANDEEKKQIVFAMVKSNRMFNLVALDKLALLDMLIGETLSSECETVFKENLVLKFGGRLCHIWICEDNWQMLKKFMDWCVTSPYQIDNLKYKILDKFSITKSLICDGNYELLDKFMHWIFCTENEIYEFKNYIGSERASVVVEALGYKDWDLFEKFVKWCFIYDRVINQFKLNILESIEHMIYNIIVYGYNFEFAEKLLNWCLNSDEAKKFKKKFLFSNIGIYEIFLTNYKVYDSKYSNWELVKMLTKWYYPLDKEVIKEFKRKLKCSTSIFSTEKRYPFYCAKVKKQALFHLLDSFALDDELSDESDGSKSEKDSSYMNSDGSKSYEDSSYKDSDESDINNVESNDSSEDSNSSDSTCSINSDAACILSLDVNLLDVSSECTDSEENCDDSIEYDEDVVILLCEILNQVSISGENMQQNYENM